MKACCFKVGGLKCKLYYSRFEVSPFEVSSFNENLFEISPFSFSPEDSSFNVYLKFQHSK